MNLLWSTIFSGIGVTVLGCLFYIAKRYFYHMKFEPKVIVKDLGKDPIKMPVYNKADINILVNTAVTTEDRRLPTYNISNLNPYNNPWLMYAPVNAQVRNQQYYMNQKAQYLNSYRTYQTNIITQNEADKSMVEIPLMLCNHGRAKGDDIEIELSFTGMLYGETNKVTHHATKLCIPRNNGHNAMAIMVTPLTSENYTYHTWNLQTPLSSPQTYNRNHMNPMGKDKEPFVVLYANTNIASQIVIHWKVLESSLANPVEGDIEISIS